MQVVVGKQNPAVAVNFVQPRMGVHSYYYIDMEQYVRNSNSYKYFVFILKKIGEEIDYWAKCDQLDDDNTFISNEVLIDQLIAKIENKWALAMATTDTAADVTNRLRDPLKHYECIQIGRAHV